MRAQLERSFHHSPDSAAAFDIKQLACPKFSSHKVSACDRDPLASFGATLTAATEHLPMFVPADQDRFYTAWEPRMVGLPATFSCLHHHAENAGGWGTVCSMTTWIKPEAGRAQCGQWVGYQAETLRLAGAAWSVGYSKTLESYP